MVNYDTVVDGYLKLLFNIGKNDERRGFNKNKYCFTPYKKLKFFEKNEKVPSGGKGSRHHVDEFKISGAILVNDKELYQNGDCIILSEVEHFLAHYLIVLGNQTRPNNGMLMGLVGSGKYTINEAVEYWDNIVKKNCSKYGIKYIPDGIKNLTNYKKLMEVKE